MLILVLLLVFIPSVSAQDADGDILSQTYTSEIYFDASVALDGNGTIDSPYNYITADRMCDNSKIYMSNGEYNLDGTKTVKNILLIGQDPEKTILSYSGRIFTVDSQMSLQNITIVGNILNRDSLTANNVIFTNSTALSADRYSNSYGGAIYNLNNLNINNCTFKNNTAEYGGAIYNSLALTTITNTRFIDNYATNYGGAIASEASSIVEISNSTFIRDFSINNAGGAIYSKLSTLNISNTSFKNCSAKFGSAITSLKSTTNINNSNFTSNNAYWDGGAIYAMYDNLMISNSQFENNTAFNGAVVVCDEITLSLKSLDFSNNNAGAVYCFNTSTDNIAGINYLNNTYDLLDVNNFNQIFTVSNYSMFKNNYTFDGEIPSYYNLADYGLVTPARDQQTSGNCWAFSAITVLESCILKASNLTFDFSEENIKNLMALYSDYGRTIDTNGGGTIEMALSYFSSWLGPVFESDDVTDDLTVLSPVLDSVVHIQNMLYLGRDNYTDNDAIKKAVLTYGAVGTSMGYYGQYMWGNSYYSYKSTTRNHAVTIVGWDDDYSADNFGYTPEGDGAWIVQNSWGENWGNNGYFYVSYYDKSFALVGYERSSYTIILNETVHYDRIYQHEVSGLTDFFVFDEYSSVYYKNIFTSAGDELLAAFSTYFEQDSMFEATVYVNDNVVATKNGTATLGYFTYDLNRLIPIEKGDNITIVIKVIVEDAKVSFPISEQMSTTKLSYAPGISYFSLDGENWIDLYQYIHYATGHHYESQVACIKVFTILPTVSSKITINNYSCFVYDNVTINIALNDIYGGAVDGVVNLTIKNRTYQITVVDGIANCTIAFNESGVYEYVVSFENDYFTYNTGNAFINVSKKASSINLDEIETSYVADEILITAHILDENGSPIDEGVVRFYLNGEIVSASVDNGNASIVYNFKSDGNYSIQACFESAGYESKNTSATVNIIYRTSKISIGSYETHVGSILNLTAKVSSAGIVDTGVVLFEIGDEKMTVNVTNGSASWYKTLNIYGNYTLHVTFMAEGYKSSNSSSSVFVDKWSSNINVKSYLIYVGDTITITANVTSPSGVVNDGEVRFNLSGEINTVKVIDGVAGFEKTFTHQANYTLQVTFLETDSHFSKTVYSKVNVFKNYGLLYLSINNITYGENIYADIFAYADSGAVLTVNNNSYVINGSGAITIPLTLDVGTYTAYLTCGNYKYAYNQVNSTFTLSKKEITGCIDVDVNGCDVLFTLKSSCDIPLTIDVAGSSYYLKNMQNITLSSLEYGNYTVDVSLNNSNYELCILDKTFSVLTYKTNITASNLVKYYRDSSRFYVTLTDSKNNVLANKTLTFIVSGVNYTKTTNNQGRASLAINLNSGNYTITTIFNGDNHYLKSHTTTNIEVKSTITTANIVKYYKNATQFSATIIGFDGNPLAKSEVVININGVFYTKTTNVNGVIRLNINLLPGEYIVSVENKVNGEIASSNLTVVSTIIDNNDLIKYYKNASRFSVKILDGKGNALGGAEVTFNINGILYTKTTNANGVAGLGINLSPGKYIVTSYYNGYAVSNNIEVLNILKSENLVMGYRDGSRFKVTILDNHGLVYPNQTVIFNINGVLYTKTTNGNGVASLNINLQAGKYIITSQYNGLSQSNTITIN